MKNNVGLTIIEVLIAIAILVGTVVTVTMMWSGNSMRIQKSKLYNHVGFLLERKAAELELEYEGKPLSEIPEELKGDFGDQYKNYKWEFKSQEFVMPDLAALHMSENKDSTTNETLLMVLNQMKDYLSKTVKEATISVVVKVKGKEARFSVTTYFVDYSQTFSLGGS